MKRFVEGQDRRQSTLLPECLDDFITEDNPVRVVEVFIDELNLGSLGFAGVVPETTGRPSYHPAVLLKIYVYGYLNRVQSSRRLEREAGRNIELMWLTGRLAPDFKTIADFRRDNGPAIRAVRSQFVALCRRLHMFTNAVVAIDGSKFKAVNNRDKNYTVTKVARRMEQVDASVARYLTMLDRVDREDSDVPEARVNRIKEKISGLRRQMHSLKEIESQVEASPDQQISLADPDARSMATSGKGTGIVGYNVQTAVDTKYHLIVAHEVTNLGHDRTQLTPMGGLAQQAVGGGEITILADRGYFNGEQVLACEGTGVLPCIPKTDTSGKAALGQFTREDFVYDAAKDHYTCPAGQILTKGAVRSDRRDDIDHYRHLSACLACALKPRCTSDKVKRFKRWQYEGVLDAMQARLERMPTLWVSAVRPWSTRSGR
jgi:transposase